MAALKPGKKKCLTRPSARCEGRPWQVSTQASALRYSRLIQTGWNRRMAATYAGGGSQAKASITTSPGVCGHSARSSQRRISIVSHTCWSRSGTMPGWIRANAARSSTHRRTCQRRPCARRRARRQHTPISPRLSMTRQKISARMAARSGQWNLAGTASASSGSSACTSSPSGLGKCGAPQSSQYSGGSTPGMRRTSLTPYSLSRAAISSTALGWPSSAGTSSSRPYSGHTQP
ncbi:Uncharacterised protein [Bordetella pertussis]|nr:Uncharacterised protein [Bordetella pertussis]